MKTYLSEVHGCQHLRCAWSGLPAVHDYLELLEMHLPKSAPSTFSLVCHSMPALALFGVLQRVSIKFASIEEGLVERCREKNQIRLFCGSRAVGKGRGIQRGPEQHHQPAGSWASAERLEIQLGLGWVL